MANVFLFGNGLSIAADQSLTVSDLTERFLGELPEGEEEFLRSLVGLAHDSTVEVDDFEMALASLENLRDSIGYLANAGQRWANDHLRQAARVLREGNIAWHLDQVFWRYTEFVLQRVAHVTPTPHLRTRLNDLLAWLQAWSGGGRGLYFFTLNYDVLLERLLVNEDFLNLGEQLTDYFLPRPLPYCPRWLRGARTFVFMPIEAEAEIGNGRQHRLFHLHGSVTHFEDRAHGIVFKVRREELEQRRVRERVRESGNLQPSIVIGGAKARKSLEFPFKIALEELRRVVGLRDVNAVLICGYSFRDPHINRALSGIRRGARIIVVDCKRRRARGTFRDLVRESTGLSVERIEWHFDGLTGPRLPGPG